MAPKEYLPVTKFAVEKKMQSHDFATHETAARSAIVEI
jgi:hypothetical protein